MSALSGMTGFARLTGEYEGHSWVWEIRSVNGKGLDIRLRLPTGFEALDQAVRGQISKIFKRGNMQINLTLQSGSDAGHFEINQNLLDRLIDTTTQKGGPVDVSKLMQVPGVVLESSKDLDDDLQKVLQAALLKNFISLTEKLKAARDQEGAALKPVLLDAVSKVEDHVAKAESLAAVMPEAIRGKVKKKLDELLNDDIPEDRLVQEAALIAIKADIREELDRLVAHCVQARELLAKGSPVGRKLDFLAQEFNRETNTLCSKSSDIDLTQTGLALKSVIEQFREQAANVE